MDREAWEAVVLGTAKSQTQLSHYWGSGWAAPKHTKWHID